MEEDEDNYPQEDTRKKTFNRQDSKVTYKKGKVGILYGNASTSEVEGIKVTMFNDKPQSINLTFFDKLDAHPLKQSSEQTKPKRVKAHKSQRSSPQLREDE